MAKGTTKAQRRGFGWVRKLPSGRYQASYLGPDTRRHNAPVTFTTKGDAEGWLNDERLLLERNLWTSPAARVEAARQAELKAKAEAVTFEAYALQWLAGRTLKPTTRERYRSLLVAKLLPTFGPMELQAITPAAVRAWWTAEGTATPTRRARTYELLRAILNTAVDDELLTASPARLKSTAAKRAHHVEPATPEQVQAIADGMPERYRLAVLLAAWCALRYGEVAELRRADVVLSADGASGRLRIRRGVTWPVSASQPVVGPPKTSAGVRDVAIPPHLLPAVTEHLKTHAQWGSDGLLFPNRQGMQTHHATLHHSWAKARAAAGRPDLHVHDLRHTGAVLAAATGATLAELMARLGHSSAAAAMRYQHAAQDRDTAIAAALSALASGSSPAAAEGTA